VAERTVVWTSTAVLQRREIFKYWNKRTGSTVYSEKLIYLIKEKVELLLKFPFLGKETTYPETRESALGNFSVYYKITEKHIIITAFWDNRQNPDSLLEELLR
jgi:plasmid stabilization system protein ParE